jgi:hypothetical protein
MKDAYAKGENLSVLPPHGVSAALFLSAGLVRELRDELAAAGTGPAAPRPRVRRLSGAFSGSDFVPKTTGVDNVCERAAVLASRGGGLPVKKTVFSGLTVAVAEAGV